MRKKTLLVTGCLILLFTLFQHSVTSQSLQKNQSNNFNGSFGLDIWKNADASPLTFSPESLSEEVNIGSSTTKTISVTNTSDTPLNLAIAVSTESTTITSVTPNQLTVSPSENASFEFTINTRDVAKGVYNDAISIRVLGTNNKLSVIPVTVRVVDDSEVPVIVVSPESYNESVQQFTTITKNLLIENTGSDNLTYSINVTGNAEENFKAQVQKSNAIIRTQGFSSLQSLNLPVMESSKVALKTESNKYSRLATSLYATDFENFELGDINNQQGWQTQYDGNWTISNQNPFEGGQHFRGVSDGLGGTRSGNILALSPTVTPSNQEVFTVASARINIQGSGVSWEIIPQSQTEELVNTRLRFNGDGSIDILNGNEFTRIDNTVPTGYFNLRIVVDREESTFKIYFDNELVFTGQSSASTIEQVVFLSDMAVTGSTIDVDNLEITDGDSEAFFLTVSPTSGNVPVNDRVNAQVKFDARGLEPGQYSATITVNSNDETNASINIPVSLTVLTPPTVVLNPESLSASTNVQTDTPPVKTKTFTVANSGEFPLEFTTSLGGINFTPTANSKSTMNSFDISKLDMSKYGKGNTTKGRLTSAGLTASKVKAKLNVLADNITYNDSIYYDSGAAFPGDFVGIQNGTALTTAMKFDVENNFTLTAVRNGFRTETATSAVRILEIYKGGGNPNEGELLLTQTFDGISQEGVVVAEVLNQALSFSAGESFWVVHKYPQGIAFVQGIEKDGTVRPNTYYYSTDGGAVYQDAPFVYFTRALSGGTNGNYITLEPSSGTVNPGENVEVTVTFNGETLPNGTYNRDIFVESNDPVNPKAKIATDFQVSGQVSEIAVSDELLLFNNVFVGAKKELSFTIENKGLAQLNLNSITSDNSDFVITPSTGTINSEGSLEVTVTFSPSTTGSINGILTINSDAANESTLEIVLNGIGVDPPIAVLNPDNVAKTTDAGTTIDAQITLSNEGNSPLTFSFPDLAVAAALAKKDVKLNNTKRIIFNESYSTKQAKSTQDNRRGHPVLYNIGTDNGFGYSWIDSDETGGPTYNFNDISTSGTSITDAVGADGTTQIPLSFPFEFYGNTYSNVYINANGFLAFQQPSDLTFINTQIPNEDSINNIIAGFWNDLEPQNAEDGGGLTYQDFGDHFVVQWTRVPKFSGTGEPGVTFQIVLYNDGNVDVFYEDVNNASFKEAATIGIENGDGKDGAQVAFNTEYVKDQLALRFVKPAITLTKLVSNVTPLSGVVAPGRSKELTVTLDATSLNDGTYYDELSVSSNDPVNVPKTLFELQVIGKPEIKVTPEALNFEPIFIGLNSTASLQVENTGTKALEISSISNTNANFSLDTSGNITLQPGNSKSIVVNFTPTTVGEITDTITITSNAFENETLEVSISGEGVAPPVIETAPEAIEVSLMKGDSTTETVSISNTGDTVLNYSFTPPYFAKAGETNATRVQYEKIEYPKIESKNTVDTRVGPKFINASGAPGTYGYSWVDSNNGGPAYEYIDISSTGEVAQLGADDSVTVDLPFNFNYFGENQNTVTIASNGFLTFAPLVGSNFINQQIPNEENPNLFIAGLWDDLEPQSGGNVFYQATQEYFIVQYENVPGFGLVGPAPAPVSFQMILYPNGSIKFQYKNVDSTIKTSSTVGLEGPLGVSGLQVIFNNEYLTNELAITFTPPVTGSVEPGQTVEIPLVLDTKKLEAGQNYTGNIVIGSNDPINPEVNIPVSLEVTRGPEVVSFTLINAYNNEEAGPLNNGDRIDLDDYSFNAFSAIANVDGTEVGSVVFHLNGERLYRDSKAPFSLRGNKNRGTVFKKVKFPIGMNTITATPYSGKRGTGIKGEPTTVTFEVFRTNAPEVVSFTLIDANTNQEVGSLNEGDVIKLSDFTDNRFSVVANVGQVSVGSVEFSFNEEETFRIDNRAPFALNGDYKRKGKRIYYPVEFEAGNNTIKATPFFRKNARGERGVPLTVNFEVIDDSTSPEEPEEDADSNLKTKDNEASMISIYPNPVRNYTQISIKSDQSKLFGYLHDLSGRFILSKNIILTNNIAKEQLNMSRLQKGIYILTILDKNKKVVTQKRIIKE